jgi:hypothetical protein
MGAHGVIQCKKKLRSKTLTQKLFFLFYFLQVCEGTTMGYKKVVYVDEDVHAYLKERALKYKSVSDFLRTQFAIKEFLAQRKTKNKK